jgi:hypothetical protein
MRSSHKLPAVGGLLLLVISGLLLNDCRKMAAMSPDVGYRYFPLVAGDTLYYQEDSIIYNDFYSTVDTFSHQVMDVTSSTFTDNSGRLSYLINRYIRDSGQQAWQQDISYAITAEPSRIEDLENNLRFVKLIFPVQLNLTWKGNIFIDPDPTDNLSYLEGWNYQYTSVNQPDTIEGMRYDSTLTVVQQPDQLIQTPEYSSEVYSVEKYARGIGLIYKDLIYWQQQCVNYDQSGNCLQLGGKGGYEVILRLTAHP